MDRQTDRERQAEKDTERIPHIGTQKQAEKQQIHRHQDLGRGIILY